MIGGEAVRSPQREPEGGDKFSVAERDDLPVRSTTPEFDWGIEPYAERLAAYAPAPLPDSAPLLVIAAEYDGRNWVGVSDNAELQETCGGHFDLLTHQIDELARRLRPWLSVAPARGHKDKIPAAGGRVEEMGSPLADADMNESFSRRLRRFFNIARR